MKAERVGAGPICFDCNPNELYRSGPGIWRLGPVRYNDWNIQVGLVLHYCDAHLRELVRSVRESLGAEGFLEWLDKEPSDVAAV